MARIKKIKITMSDIDLAFVVRAECGCFAKLHYELESKGWVDRDREYCGLSRVDKNYDHAQQFYKLALERADQLAEIATRLLKVKDFTNLIVREE